jgi:hypothetical protein
MKPHPQPSIPIPWINHRFTFWWIWRRRWFGRRRWISFWTSCSIGRWSVSWISIFIRIC